MWLMSVMSQQPSFIQVDGEAKSVSYYSKVVEQLHRSLAVCGDCCMNTEEMQCRNKRQSKNTSVPQATPLELPTILHLTAPNTYKMGSVLECINFSTNWQQNGIMATNLMLSKQTIIHTD